MRMIGRAAAGVVLALLGWWFALRGPSASLLLGLARVPLALLVAPSGLPAVTANAAGEWLFNVEVGARSVEFAAEPGTADDFTAGWFIYLGLAFAAGAMADGGWRSVAKGLLAQVVMGLADLTLFVMVSGHAALLGPGDDGWRSFFGVADYVLGGVIPLAGPFAVALIFHPKWRGYFQPYVT